MYIYSDTPTYFALDHVIIFTSRLENLYFQNCLVQNKSDAPLQRPLLKVFSTITSFLKDQRTAYGDTFIYAQAIPISNRLTHLICYPIMEVSDYTNQEQQLLINCECFLLHTKKLWKHCFAVTLFIPCVIVLSVWLSTEERRDRTDEGHRENKLSLSYQNYMACGSVQSHKGGLQHYVWWRFWRWKKSTRAAAHTCQNWNQEFIVSFIFSEHVNTTSGSFSMENWAGSDCCAPPNYN